MGRGRNSVVVRTSVSSKLRIVFFDPFSTCKATAHRVPATQCRRGSCAMSLTLEVLEPPMREMFFAVLACSGRGAARRTVEGSRWGQSSQFR